MATGSDACGSVTITYSDSVTTNCGGTKVVSRLWTATDACGNATNGLQTLTMQDTTPPTLDVPRGVVLDCPADITPARNGTATALDACGSVTVSYNDSVTTN